MKEQKDFLWSDQCEPHKLRTRQLINKYPEIRKLIGRNPYTFLVILFCVVLQTTLAFLLKDASWWLVFGLAYFVGAFADHTLFVCVHECSHNLVFKKRSLNVFASLVANLPLVFASSVSFKKYHLKHHAFQGIEALDADMPGKREASLVGNSTIKKALWLLFYPLAQASRLGRLNKEVKLFDKEMALNWLIQLVFVFFIVVFCGWKGFFFLLASFFFSVGLHPLGARWIQEHFLTDGLQETKSYYGPLNVPNLNVGLHNEHHDFPSVPWNHLPALHKIAGEYYDGLASHKSYTKLLVKFLFDRNLSVFSRMARDNKGKSVEKERLVHATEIAGSIQKET